jgi:hypothetical protein
MRFDGDDVAVIRKLAERGHSAKSIAVALDRPVQAVRVKLCALGIHVRRPPMHHEARTPVDERVWRILQHAATRRRITVSRLVSSILTTLVADQILDAVLDDKPR